MYLPLLGIVAIFAIALIVGIMWFTRERAGHNVRHDVNQTTLAHQPIDPRGIRR